MFDFEKFEVYIRAKDLVKGLSEVIADLKGVNPRIIDQLQRASLSIPFNIAEGAGRYSKADKKNFYIIARCLLFNIIIETN
jgi:four helix bundle protein